MRIHRATCASVRGSYSRRARLNSRLSDWASYDVMVSTPAARDCLQVRLVSPVARSLSVLSDVDAARPLLCLLPERIPEVDLNRRVHTDAVYMRTYRPICYFAFCVYQNHMFGVCSSVKMRRDVFPDIVRVDAIWKKILIEFMYLLLTKWQRVQNLIHFLVRETCTSIWLVKKRHSHRCPASPAVSCNLFPSKCSTGRQQSVGNIF